ncbi:hypothetical protein [Leuconostoc citreum]
MISKEDIIKNAQALDRSYGIALAFDIEVGNPDLHEEIYELLCHYLKENNLQFDDLD